MADPMVADPVADLDALPIRPLDTPFLSDDLTFSLDNTSFISFHDNDEVLDLDFTFDDMNLPSETEDFLNSTLPASIPLHISSDPDDYGSNSKSSDFVQVSDDVTGYFNVSPSNSGYKSSDVVTRVSNCSAMDQVSGDRGSGNAGVLNGSSSESLDCCQESGTLDVSRVLNCDAQDRNFSGPTSSQGSDDYARYVASSPNSGNGVVVDQKIKVEQSDKNGLLKRKKESEEAISESTRTIKYRRSNAAAVEADRSDALIETKDEEEKRKARLMRNRESAQLSRQRKKHYVEELEDKVRAMHSTIQDLNAKISYIAAENATLRHQMSGGGGALGRTPVPGMYPHPPMAPVGYPWMPCPPYVVKPQGSQVPLVPIPRLKPQQQQQTPKTSKKGESKKSEGRSKTKKVASVSFLGLLFFMLLFGGLVPTVHVNYGGMRDAFTGRSVYIGNKFYGQHHARVLMVNGTNHEGGTRVSNKKFNDWKDYNNSSRCGGGHVGGAESNVKQSSSEDFARPGNASEPLVASLYVPRNDKLVKIDGNLIIHSVLASEKAMSSHEDGEKKSGRETSLAVALNLAPAISVPRAGQNNVRHPRLYRSTAEHQRALGSGPAAKDNLKSTPVDGKLQQWFREGLAGPMLSSGMCTEVFQFDVSPTPGAIIAAASVRNISVEESQNSTRLNKGRNRRILHGHPIPLAGNAKNISKESAGSNSQKENSHRNSSLSPMIVSVLVDPREVGNADGDGVMGTKSISRIFVVVLLDGVKYVTYSCMLPFKGSSHLVTA